MKKSNNLRTKKIQKKRLKKNSKKKITKVESNVSKLSDFFLLEKEGLDIVRRSDRIKTIEVVKQHHYEMKIAEKIKKHINHNISDASPYDNQVIE